MLKMLKKQRFLPFSIQRIVFMLTFVDGKVYKLNVRLNYTVFKERVFLITN